MKTITLSEYNKISPDFRGVWTTERDDQPNWDRDRHLYMGKRTMMSQDGRCHLLVEGLSFMIVDDTPKYLIFADHHAAVIDVPAGFSSDDYGILQTWFAARTRGDRHASMRRLYIDQQVDGIFYNDELSGPDGASFELYAFPDTSEESLIKAESFIRRSFDCTSMRILRFKKLHKIQDEVNRIFSESLAK